MKVSEINKVIKTAQRAGILYFKELDKILEDEDNFVRNAELLIHALKNVTFVQDLKDSEGGACEAIKEGALAKISSKRTSPLSAYLQEINRLPRMDRAVETLFSKRLEFFRRRLLHHIECCVDDHEMREMLLRFKECPGSPDEQDVTPLCTKHGTCPRGKEGHLQECCSMYNRIRAEFVERNLHLVVNLTRQYRSFRVPLMDLVQEGNAALIRAVEKFDWRKGVRFQTYGTFWIKQAIERWISASKGIVRVPNYLQQKMRRFQRNGVLSNEGGSMSVRDVSNAFELSSEVAGHLLESGRGHVSLDAPKSEGDEKALAEVLSMKEDDVLPASELIKLQGRLSEALSVLSNQERSIIAQRFGLGDKEPKTLEEIGNLMNVSRERIRQLQNHAIQKLKRPSLLKRLAPFLS